MTLQLLIILLKENKYINIFGSMIFTLHFLTLFIIKNPSIYLFLIAFILLIFQNYYAFRISLDAKFFEILASKNDEETLKNFDHSLYELKLIKQIKTRSLNERIRGTIQLVKKQLFLTLFQPVLYLIFLLLILY